ncbi:hypothetical protein [Candidatus Contendibacter odensensis]|uniref:Uncharacterized protein n=1 Tax=Candidatus Contendobacter odensis Run_B_J11 TaxID=1400861 RepID=A0A7U7J5W6_9GAMM|nr:hypothetical protein [Candidatus Contendobacter odensis]CDH46988.1 hypothetical protein BN874_690038 [Candidatus Contendobacter odensis Run_B_J11]
MNALTRIEVPAVSMIPFDDIARMGKVMASSKLFGIQTEQQAIALMLLCQAENLHPATAMRDYHLIQGRPALKADAMLARFQAAGGKVQWGCYTDERVSGTFTHPAGDSITIEWTPQRAVKAQIKNDMHSKYPRQMLKARCISEGIRAIFPGVLSGMYAPEEVVELNDAPVAPVTPIAPTGSRSAALKATLADKLKPLGEALDREGPMPADMNPITGELMEPEVDPIADLLLALAECQSQEELEAYREAVAALKNGLKKRAVAAWKATQERIAL